MATVLVFFRQVIWSSFRSLSGDDSDTLIEISILEHWRAAFAGIASWDRTSYFFPHLDTLGYNDGFLLHGMIYTIFRLARVDPFLSSELVNIVLKLIGYAGFVLFARRVCVLPIGASIAGAALFTLANNSFLQVGHAQLFSVALVPVLGLLMAETARNTMCGRMVSATVWSVSAALLFGACLLTSFYTIWFFCLFCLVAGLSAAFMTTRQEWWELGRLAGTLTPYPYRLLAINALAWIACLLPFLRIYMPTALESGMHSFHDVTNYWPSLLDVVHVGPGSVLFAWLDDGLAVLRGPDANGEHLVGFTPTLIVMALIGAGVALGRWWARPRGVSLLYRSVAAAVLVCLVLVVHVGPYSLWTIVFHVVPGARAVRASGRLLLVLTAPMCLAAAWALAWLQAAGVRRTVLLAIGALLLVGELNVGAYDMLSRPLELRRIALVQPSPHDCLAFYATGLAPEEAPQSNGLYHPNVDAMLISAIRGIPTVNGYSSFNPADWAFDTSQPSYAIHVGAYALLHHLSGLCALDVGTGRWSMPRLPTPDLAYGRLVRLDGRSDGASFLGGGWAIEEPDNGIWSMRSDANLVLRMPAPGPGHDLVFEASVSALSRNGRPDAVAVSLNGQPGTLFKLDTTTRSIRVHLSGGMVPADGLVDVVFRKVVLRSPHDVWHAADTRQLGIYLRSFRVLEVDGPAR